MQKRNSCHLKIVEEGVKGNNQSDTVPYYLLFGNCWLKTLHKLFDFSKKKDGIFFVSQRFYNLGVVK